VNGERYSRDGEKAVKRESSRSPCNDVSSRGSAASSAGKHKVCYVITDFLLFWMFILVDWLIFMLPAQPSGRGTQSNATIRPFVPFPRWLGGLPLSNCRYGHIALRCNILSIFDCERKQNDNVIQFEWRHCCWWVIFRKRLIFCLRTVSYRWRWCFWVGWVFPATQPTVLKHWMNLKYWASGQWPADILSLFTTSQTPEERDFTAFLPFLQCQ